MKLDEYNIVEASEESVEVVCIREIEHPFHGSKWCAQLNDKSGMFLISSTMEYLVKQIYERKYPITRENLEKACHHCVDAALIPDEFAQDIVTTPVEMSFPDKVKHHVDKLHYALQKTCLGRDYAVLTCVSQNQAKKVFKILSKKFSQSTRREKDILVLE